MVSYFLITDGHHDIVMEIHEGKLGCRNSWVIEPFFDVFSDSHVEFLRKVQTAFEDDESWGGFVGIILPTDIMKVNGFVVTNITFEYQSSYNWHRRVLDRLREKGMY